MGRRNSCRLTLQFKIINNLVIIPQDDRLTFNERSNEIHNSHRFKVKKNRNIDSYQYYFVYSRKILDWNTLSQKKGNCQTLKKLMHSCREASNSNCTTLTGRYCSESELLSSISYVTKTEM